ncbi:hypothetical protein [Flavisolibacter tropicus]|uniref:Uncharacterized protein n=1 Tax=Flavisolibacter tropicus TaxID=1492898 RepID=A0A172TWL2_9BACT|nr:hypothetical protein [Flavisolibacter tropicus]ANE51501.1 hypothetical protein SY85_14295 [Flavisolibacter tropicus]
MSEQFSENQYTVTDPETRLALDHLDRLLQVQLAALPDSSFKTIRFIPLANNRFVNIYSRQYFPKAAQLFARAEVSLVGKGIKRVVFTGSLPVKDPGPLLLLIDDLITILGKDLFNKTGFNTRDIAGLKRGRWAGRRWLLCFDKGQRMPLLLDLLDGQLQLCLYLPV